jgi:hypothetical protein
MALVLLFLKWSQNFKERNLTYGKDVAVVISNDAVHYGNESWSDLAPLELMMQVLKSESYGYGVIITCLVNGISNEKVKVHSRYTVQKMIISIMGLVWSLCCAIWTKFCK